MKKLWSIFLFSAAAGSLAHAESLRCASDATITIAHEWGVYTYPEFHVEVVPQNQVSAKFAVYQYYRAQSHLSIRLLAKQVATIQPSATHYTVTGAEWSLAISPNKERASLYSTNPYLNEVPMFCLSTQ